MTSSLQKYGSIPEDQVLEDQPILPRTPHPFPGEGNWGERGTWVGAISQRRFPRVFFDPVLYQIDEVESALDEKKVGFRYLKEEEIVVKNYFTSFLPEVHLKSLLIYFLLFVAILMDGIRPIVLVWSKGKNKQYPYMFSVWVVLVKIVVVIFSLIMWAISRENKRAKLSFRKKCWLSLYFVFPVICYVTSDILNFVLFEHQISATLFACIKQSRIIITAVLFRFGLHRKISPIQWVAVIQLCLASVLFVADDIKSNDSSVSEDAVVSEQVTGIMWLLLKCLIDALAVIWMDRYFKALDSEGFPYAEQQVVFALFSLMSGIIFFFAYNLKDFESGRPFLDGFNAGAWWSVIVTALYGILVSLVLRYLDSMVKQFQALLAVVVTTLLDQAVFGKVISLTSWVAIVDILISVFLYKLGAAGKKTDHNT